MKRLIAGLAFVALSACQPSEPLRITGATYRPPIGASDLGVAYLTLRSEKTDRIVGVSSPMAKAVEIHTSVMTGTTGSMRRLESLDLPAGKDVVFSGGGTHLMVFSPQSLKAGDATFPIEFRLESGATRIVLFSAGTGPG